MRTTVWLLLTLAAILTTATGCSDDSTAPTANQSYDGMIEGEIGDADFEFIVAGSRSSEGPFALRGTNLHYVDSLQALVVDLTVTNQGEVTHPEPIALTFVRLLPDGATVLNPDNGINEEGAAVEFAFANTDGDWTPGENSLPRTVQFGVGAGTSIGFGARLDVGAPGSEGGMIAGRVWNDANQDGVLDPDEGGIADVLVVLNDAGDDSVATEAETHTDEDGNYAFGGLRSGVYTVSKPPADDITPTTPSQITVLLTEVNGEVSDFTEANFGCVVADSGDGDMVGAFVEVNGDYRTDPDRVVARGVDVSRCESDLLRVGLDHDDDDDGEDGDDDDGEDCSRGKLRGPVTDIDEDAHTFSVMGTVISTDENGFPDDLEVGDRVDARVRHGDDGTIVLERLKEWHSPHEQVHGRVDEINFEDGVLQARVLNTLVVVSHDKLAKR